jgi:hypothetical protein
MPKTKDKPPELTPQQLIAIERERRALTCQAEINAVLKRHNCQLQAQVTFSGSGSLARTVVVAGDPPVPG